MDAEELVNDRRFYKVMAGEAFARHEGDIYRDGARRIADKRRDKARV